MTSRVIREWLSEYKSLPEEELNTYACMLQNKEELKDSLFRLFDEDFTQEIVDPVCHQLFDFYRSGRTEFQRFSLEFVPTLITAYLTDISRNEKKKTGGIEACLLGVYNLEIVNKDGTQHEESITIPTLAVPSIYHEPPSLATLALTESALMRYHSAEPVTISNGPLPMIERLNAQNRYGALTHLLHCYNKQVAVLSARSHKSYCKMASRLCRTGFENVGSINGIDYTSLNDSFSSTSSRSSSRRNVKFVDEPRIPLNSSMLIEMLNGIYYIMFNNMDREASEAVDSIHNRACYELYADVILVTNAIKNSLMFNPSGAPEEGPMGISVALSPTSSNSGVNKHAITNASFRAKKLPDDIPEVDNLEEEQDTTPMSASRKMSQVTLSPDLKVKLPKVKVTGGRRGSRLHSKSDDIPGPSQINQELDSEPKSIHRKPTETTLTQEPKVKGPKVRITTKKTRRQSSKSDDIEVIQGEDPPPDYQEVVESDKGKTDKFKLSKPLKSIMKTGQEKMRKKESEAKRHKDSADGQSPRQSLVASQSSSMVSSHSSTSVNGEGVDPNMVQVSVIQGGSRTTIDHMELRNLDIQHRRTASYPEGNFTQPPSSPPEDSTEMRSMSTSQSREIQVQAGTAEGETGSQGSKSSSLNMSHL